MNFTYAPPTFDRAEEALRQVDALLDGFRFPSPLDRSVALSALMSAALRGRMDAVPMHLITTTKPGPAGKSFLADLAYAVAVGGFELEEDGCPSIRSHLSKSRAEKRLEQLIKERHPVIAIEDVHGPVTGWGLPLYVEGATVVTRVPRTQRSIEVASRSLIITTGDAATVRDEMVRRTVVCFLDPFEKSDAAAGPLAPETAADVVCKDHEACGAAFETIVDAYIAAGSPEVCAHPLASFADWTATVRSPLVWLGRPDPAGGVRALERVGR